MIYAYWFQWMCNDRRKYCHVRAIQSSLIKIQLILMMPKHVLKSWIKTSFCLYLYINIVQFCWKFVQCWWRLKRIKPVFNALHWSHNKIKISRWFDVLASSVIKCQLIHDTCTMQSLAEATIVVFEVLIGNNSRPDCARASVDISSDSETSNAFFKICWACMWRDFWGNRVFLRCQKFSGFYLKSRGAETKHVVNKVFTEKMSVTAVTLQSNCKNEVFWWGHFWTIEG